MSETDPDPIFTLTLIAEFGDLQAGVRALDMPGNALTVAPIADDATPGDAHGCVLYPSPFVSDVAFVGLIAHFLRSGLEMRLELTESEGANGRIRQHACVHPGLDDATLALLREIDPRRASDQDQAQRRAQRVLDALRDGAAGIGFLDGCPPV